MKTSATDVASAPIGHSLVEPLVIVKPIEPMTVVVHVGEALLAALALKTLAWSCPDEAQREAMRNVGCQLEAAARVHAHGAGTEIK